MKHVFTFQVIAESEHNDRSPDELAKEIRNWLPRRGDGMAGGNSSRKGYYTIKIKKVELRSTRRAA